jgi:plastocyanin
MIRLSNFAFTPEYVLLKSGEPVQLHLVNESGGGHSFSAPAFFAAASYPSGVAPRDGKVEIPADGSADITVIPRAAGTYRVECTHFLHSLFGMTGTIVVSAP